MKPEGEKSIQPSNEFVKEMTESGAKTPSKSIPAVDHDSPSQVEAAKLYPKLVMPSAAQLADNEDAKTKFHIGIFVIAAVEIIIGLLAVFTSQNILGSIPGITAILIGVGILLRQELARKIVLVLISLSFVLTLSATIGFITIEQSTNAKADRAMQAIETAPKTTAAQKENAQKLTTLINQDQASVHAMYQRLYLTFGLQMLYWFILLVYLTRPSIKASFR